MRAKWEKDVEIYKQSVALVDALVFSVGVCNFFCRRTTFKLVEVFASQSELVNQALVWDLVLHVAQTGFLFTPSSLGYSHFASKLLVKTFFGKINILKAQLYVFCFQLKRSDPFF